MIELVAFLAVLILSVVIVDAIWQVVSETIRHRKAMRFYDRVEQGLNGGLPKGWAFVGDGFIVLNEKLADMVKVYFAEYWPFDKPIKVEIYK